MSTKNLSLLELNQLFQRMLDIAGINYKYTTIYYSDYSNNVKWSYRYYLTNSFGFTIIVDIMDDNSNVNIERYNYYLLSQNTLADKATAIFAIYSNKEVIYPRMLELINGCMKEVT